MTEKNTMKDKKKKKQQEGQAPEQGTEQTPEQGPEQTPSEAQDNESRDDGAEEGVSELEALKDKLLRALSENENNRRRFEREMAEKVRYAHGEFAQPLLSVLDGFKQALVDEVDSVNAQDQEGVARWRDMLQATFREMEQTFTQFGIVRIEANRGEAFDYRLHEAVSESHDDGVEAGHIVSQLRCGYQLHDRLLRPAMVVVRPVATKGD